METNIPLENASLLDGNIDRSDVQCLGHMTSSMVPLILFEQCTVYAMACNKRLNFSRLFFNKMFEFITGNKKPTYVPYPRWLALILAHVGEGYNVNHVISFQIPSLSLKIISSPINGDANLTMYMENLVVHPYEVEDS
ncbi:unnamed protein product [Lactuca saligna]|uniref:Uncharacterized protein n=1 Tax=Lactuca saligna TaxID=75948 RepID=A0AA35VMH7_LACSI|nr:unnamed protein product [Lactuca saligna]